MGDIRRVGIPTGNINLFVKQDGKPVIKAVVGAYFVNNNQKNGDDYVTDENGNSLMKYLKYGVVKIKVVCAGGKEYWCEKDDRGREIIVILDKTLKYTIVLQSNTGSIKIKCVLEY